MRKILIVFDRTLDFSGVPNYLFNFVNAIKNKYIIDIVANGIDNENFETMINTNNITLYVHNFISLDNGSMLFFKRYLDYKRFFKNLFEKNDYDIVYCHNLFESGIVLELANKKNFSSRIAHCHGFCTYSKKNFLYNFYINLCLKKLRKNSTHRLSCSKEAGKTLFGEYDFNIIPNPIELSKYEKFIPKSHFGLNLLQIGYFCENKNQLFSLELLSKMLQNDQNINLYFIGYSINEKYYNKMLEFIEKNNLDSNVHFLEPNTSKIEIFSKIDYLFLPSKNEAFGIVLLEAQACNVKCLVSNTVPMAANAGLCEFLELNVDSWISFLNNSIKNKPNYNNNIKNFDVNKIMDELMKITNI